MIKILRNKLALIKSLNTNTISCGFFIYIGLGTTQSRGALMAACLHPAAAG